MFVLSACGSNEAQKKSESENPTKENTRVVEDELQFQQIHSE